MTYKKLGCEDIGTHLLTHGEWNGMPHMFSHGSNETGIYRLANGKIIDDSFELIQHGWHNLEAASSIIKKCLKKEFDACRIEKILDRLKAKSHTKIAQTLDNE